MIETRRFPCKLNASVISNWQTSLSKYHYPIAVAGEVAAVVSVGGSVPWVVLVGGSVTTVVVDVPVIVVSVIVVAAVVPVVALGRHV